MDLNGPFFIIKEKQYYNPTDIYVILTWEKQGLKLLAFAINFPIIFLLNAITLKFYLWLDERKIMGSIFLAVVLIYLTVAIIWYLLLRQSEILGLLFHPLAVLMGVGFFVSNIFFFSFWYLYEYMLGKHAK